VTPCTAGAAAEVVGVAVGAADVGDADAWDGLGVGDPAAGEVADPQPTTSAMTIAGTRA